MTLQCSTPPHSKCDAPSQLFTPDSQPRHGGSNYSGGSAIVTHVTCDAPSQLISLVLLTASLELQAISISKRKMLLVSPLRRLAYRVITTRHNTTQHNTTQHNTAQHNMTRHNTTRHDTTRHDTTRHDTTRHDTTRHDTIRYDTIRYNWFLSMQFFTWLVSLEKS